MLPQRLQFGTEHQRAAGPAVVQRLLADTVTGQPQALFLPVPQGDREHAVAALQGVFDAPLQDRCQQDFGVGGEGWLNANESAWANPADAAGSSRRYPEPQPLALREGLAALYGVTPQQRLVGRGSDEAIDLLVRALCVPGRDGVLVTSPVFGMYAVCARLQGAPLIDVPLVDGEDGLRADLDAVIRTAREQRVKLVFLCAPSNPAGSDIALDEVERVAVALRGQALVVVDEAYVEYAQRASATTLLAAHANLAVLRTLSKAHALAAARVGALIAAPDLIAVLRRCQAPYPVPTPCAELAVQALQPAALARTAERVATVIAERKRLCTALAGLAGVRRVRGGGA
ncbi:hypothetical protein G6F59_013085 [Rhizopus arrhizus]|nr:hypothetical protein G6F59_013085 [Rhizopus arrhizus]